MPARPSSREMEKKARDALEAVRAGRCSIAELKHLTLAYEFLGITTHEELWDEIERLLAEVLKAGAAKCYCGGHPPQLSYEAAIKGDELWAYAWESSLLNVRVYLKFVIKKHYFLFVDCHESQETQ